MGHVVQVLTFRVPGITADDRMYSSEVIGLGIAEFPGFVDGHCLTDLTRGVVGGVTIWENQAALDRFRHSEMYARLMMSPSYDEAVDRAFDAEELEGGDVMSQVTLAVA